MKKVNNPNATIWNNPKLFQRQPGEVLTSTMGAVSTLINLLLSAAAGSIGGFAVSWSLLQLTSSANSVIFMGYTEAETVGFAVGMVVFVSILLSASVTGISADRIRRV